MQFSKARYVTLCQQLLVTAVVLVVAMSAAGVVTLEIVAPKEPEASNLAPAVKISDAYVDTKPVDPKVREVAVKGVEQDAIDTLPAHEQEAAEREVVRKPTGGAAQQKDEARTAAGAQPALAALSIPEKVSGYATVGVTWEHGTEIDEKDITISVRTRKDGAWSGWEPVDYHDDHGPDAGSAGSARVRPGTDAVVVGDVDEVQMKAVTADGVAPKDLELAVIDPGTGTVKKEAPAIDTGKLAAADEAAVKQTAAREDGGDPTTAKATLSAMKVAPKPTIYSRAQWGANEKIRESGLPDYGRIYGGFVHHTVNANNYTRAQVPALIRGIYAYHVKSRGWRDIGYNFLVDRFGRIWEGRFGGVDKAVVGAHTKNYNQYSFAMSALGNFDIYDHGRGVPPSAMLDAYGRLFAWKLSLSGVRADATNVRIGHKTFRSSINGHRDAGSTACPGRYLYAKLPTIRALATKYQKSVATPTLPQAPGPVAPTSLPERLSVTGNGWPDLVVRARSGGAMYVLPTAGLTGFRSGTLTGSGWNGQDLITAVGDVNGDRRGDVIARTASTKTARLFAGDGAGHVRGGTMPTTLFRYVDKLVGVGDFDKDGKNDVVARQGSGTRALYLFRGNGKGRFSAPVLIAANMSRYTDLVSPGDFDGDGIRDLIAKGTDKALWLFKGHKAGRLGAPVKLSVGGAQFDQFAGAGDFTRDGKADLVARNAATGDTYLIPGNGKGGFAHYLGPFPQAKGLTGLSGGNMTGSADPDLVGRDSRGRLVVVPHNGMDNFSSRITSGVAIPDSEALLSAGDWNSDGKADLVTREAGGDSLWLRPGTGKGTWGARISMGGSGWKGLTQFAAVGDVTGDGHPDLAGRTSDGFMRIYAGNGRTGFIRAYSAGNKLRSYNQVGGGTGIWNALRLPEATLVAPDGTFVPFVGTAAASSVFGRSAGSLSAYDWILGVGDVDGDNQADLLVRDKASHYLWLLPGSGSGFDTRRFIMAGFGGYDLLG